MPLRKAGNHQQNSEQDSPELLSEEGSRKTDSGSSLANIDVDKQSAYSGCHLIGQNFSYSNFHSFGGGNSPQEINNNEN